MTGRAPVDETSLHRVAGCCDTALTHHRPRREGGVPLNRTKIRKTVLATPFGARCAIGPRVGRASLLG